MLGKLIQKLYRSINHLTTTHIILIFIVIGLLTYANSLKNNFVIDDIEQIQNNPAIHSLSNLPHLFFGSTFNSGGAMQLSGSFYRPLMMVLFSLIYQFAGPIPWIFHLAQIFLHIAIVFLLFLLFNQFFRKPLSFFLALIFLVHPINQEVIAYISNTQDILFNLFGLLSILTLKKALFAKSKYNTHLTLLFLFLSLLSKETAILYLIPLVFIARQTKKTGQFYSLIIGTLGLYAGLRYLAIGLAPAGTNTPLQQATILERLYTIPSSVAKYFTTLAIPYPLTIGHYWVNASLDPIQVILPTGLLLFGILLLILLRPKNHKHSTIYFLALTWLIIGILVHHNPILPLDATFNYRWFYFPFIGLLIILGYLIQSIKNLEKIIILPFLLLIPAYILLTNIRNTNWRNNYILAYHDVQYNPDSFFLHSMLGYEYYQQNDLTNALNEIHTSLTLFSHRPNTWNTLGIILEKQYAKQKKEEKDESLLQQAINMYQKSINLHGGPNPYQNISRLYLQTKQYDQAKDALEKALTMYPNNPVFWAYLSQANWELNDRQASYFAGLKFVQLAPTPENQAWFSQTFGTNQ